jgi:hypothetical protein
MMRRRGGSRNLGQASDRQHAWSLSVCLFWKGTHMNINCLKYFLAVILLAYIGGCANTFVPTMREEFAPGTIPEFSSKNGITLQNDHMNVDNVMFMRSGMHYYLANPHECSDMAVAIVKREITKRGMRVGEDNARSLKLSVESISTDVGWWKHDIVIQLTAITGSGFRNDYEGRGGNGSGWGVYEAADVALSDSVAKMLSDPKIVDYLTK